MKALTVSTAMISRFAALLLVSAPVWAAVAPVFTTDGPFAVTSSTYTNTVAGTTINGNVCFTTGPAATPTINGTSGACPAGVGADQTSASSTLMGQPCTIISGPLEAVIIGANPPGTFPPGCYTSVGALNLTANGVVTLNGNGVYVFRSTGGAITTGANSVIQLAGGACAAEVFWTAAGATTLGGASTFVGTIVDAAGVTLGLAANLSGRALAFGGTVTTNGANTITVPSACALPPGASTVTLAKVSNGGVGSFTFTGNNGITPQTITTVIPATGVAGAPLTLGAAGVATTITEAAAAGFTLASATCSGLGAGGTATTNLATSTVTLDAAATAAGSTISCTFTNTATVVGPVAPSAPIPTLSEWAMIALSLLIALAGFAALRGRKL